VKNLDDDREVRRSSSRSDALVDDSNFPVEVRPVSIGVGIDAQLVTVHTPCSGAFVAGTKSVSAESSLLLASWPASNSFQGRQSGFPRSRRGSAASSNLAGCSRAA
jgi:hypothetical protein